MEKKRTFTKVERDNMDFFHETLYSLHPMPHGVMALSTNQLIRADKNWAPCWRHELMNISKAISNGHLASSLGAPSKCMTFTRSYVFSMKNELIYVKFL
jgi:hypothetical protein